MFRPSALLPLISALSLLLALSGGAWAQLAAPSIDIAAKSWYLHDAGSGQELASSNPDERIEPASLTKLMTAYLAFAAVKQGKLKLDQTLPVSEHAWRAEGSRMFIEPKTPVTVDELLHGMIIQSGNDASIALAEAIGGSEEGFARMMNREAQRLGLKNSSFRNATGLPDPQHYSTARDMAALANALIRDFPEYYPLYSTKQYRYNNITQPNRNRLLWSDPHVDGMKTGHTKAAGYCLVASAKRGERRLISVVLGTASENARANESQRLLNFGFQAFDSVKLYTGNQAISQLPVYKGAQRKVKAGFGHDFMISVPAGQSRQLKVELVSLQPLLAPVTAGQQVARLKLTLGEKPYGEFPVIALEAVPTGGIFSRAWDTLRLWFE
ncbi:D-alanyl-D-alanine carboxypeptidase DacC [Sterolibacterium denitrificans]|uniref:serine-type D-Ala-D-Ala carboxypeptidase n=1 Tax=Sterolibacterium denitrificans TaxID=157592 RepID=A0A7Z7HPS0_9PROT|nr:D-alanyl-D-alanine carboxypeptidase family protein [Sterolibacterium denitrificans]SMB22983.1 D-alanyl-D-alanine carboxypeptidase DacC [Sterolibacterium denitrificans]